MLNKTEFSIATTATSLSVSHFKVQVHIQAINKGRLTSDNVVVFAIKILFLVTDPDFNRFTFRDCLLPGVLLG